MEDVAQKLSLPCPFDILDVYGGKFKFWASRTFMFDTKHFHIQGVAYVLVQLSETVQSLAIISQKFYFLLISRFLSKLFMDNEIGMFYEKSVLRPQNSLVY